LKDESHFNIFDLSDHLRARGWQIPAYSLAENAKHISIMRVVVQESFSVDMADRLIIDIIKAVEYLNVHYRAIEDRVNHERYEGDRSITSFVHL